MSIVQTAMQPDEAVVSDGQHIASIALDGTATYKAEIEQERQVAIGDLLRSNQFSPHGVASGPYDVVLSVRESRLYFTLQSATLAEPHSIMLPMRAFRSIIRDYFMVCEHYFEAIRSADPYKVEAVDMGRRGIHNEGSELLQSQLRDKITMDFDTARRLFTLICVLHL